MTNDPTLTLIGVYRIAFPDSKIQELAEPVGIVDEGVLEDMIRSVRARHELFVLVEIGVTNAPCWYGDEELENAGFYFDPFEIRQASTQDEDRHWFDYAFLNATGTSHLTEQSTFAELPSQSTNFVLRCTFDSSTKGQRSRRLAAILQRSKSANYLIA